MLLGLLYLPLNNNVLRYFYSGANGGLGGTIILRLTDSDAGLLLMFIKSWTPDIIYSLNVKGGNGG